MTQYRHIEATGRTDEVTVIEDPGMVTERADGTIRPDSVSYTHLTLPTTG